MIRGTRCFVLFQNIKLYLCLHSGMYLYTHIVNYENCFKLQAGLVLIKINVQMQFQASFIHTGLLKICVPPFVCIYLPPTSPT